MARKGTLFVVATPIGNLEDISKRAVEVLRSVHIAAAEDTRRTGQLLSHVGAEARLESFHRHSPESKLTTLLNALDQGMSVALVSDAGTPLVSDPGIDLVRAARDGGVEVVPIPGPSAVTAALSAAGFDADQYTFLGFLPRKGKARRTILREVADSPRTVVLFESPNRVADTLADLGSVLESRRVMVAREISKLYEEFNLGTPEELEVYYRREPARGEVTVVVEGRPASAPAVDREFVEDRARELLASGVSKKDAVARIIEDYSLPRNEVYRIVTEL